MQTEEQEETTGNHLFSSLCSVDAAPASSSPCLFDTFVGIITPHFPKGVCPIADQRLQFPLSIVFFYQRNHALIARTHRRYLHVRLYHHMNESSTTGSLADVHATIDRTESNGQP